MPTPVLSIGALFAAIGVTVLPPEYMARYTQWMSQEAGIEKCNRWEDGKTHRLPQDYADMLSWPEIASLVVEDAYRSLPAGSTPIIYCNNYGTAGAIRRYADEPGMPEAVSFSDMYAVWMPDTVVFDAMIYVNYEPSDLLYEHFVEVDTFATVTTPYARENGPLIMTAPQPVGDPV